MVLHATLQNSKFPLKAKNNLLKDWKWENDILILQRPLWQYYGGCKETKEAEQQDRRPTQVANKK